LRFRSATIQFGADPYSVGDATDFTIPEHGERRGLPHVGIELREDLISAEAG
jgi:predicted N-formylglutamate amidohydrolase